MIRCISATSRTPARNAPSGSNRGEPNQHEPSLALPKSIATVSLSGTLPEKLEAAAAIGFDGVEIFENDLLTLKARPTDVRSLAESLGLTITCFQPFRDFEAMPEPQRAPQPGPRRTQVRRHAGSLGTDLLLVCSNVSSRIDR